MVAAGLGGVGAAGAPAATGAGIVAFDCEGVGVAGMDVTGGDSPGEVTTGLPGLTSCGTDVTGSLWAGEGGG